MRALWVSCLLLGSVTCLPPQDFYRGFPPSTLGQQAQYEKPSEQAAGYNQNAGYSVSYSPNMATGTASSPGYFTSASGQQQAQPSYQSGPSTYYFGTSAGGADSTSGAGSQQSGQSGSTGGQYQVQQQSWSSSSDGDSDQEPVFTPVSEEDQVYAFKSRSRYNQKRLQFSQFRYTPTEPLVLETPEFPYHGKGSGSKGPVKGKY